MGACWVLFVAPEGGGWPLDVLGTLARLLEVHALLTAEEATWLQEAGASWSDCDDSSPI